jgi:hypothetical protein
MGAQHLRHRLPEVVGCGYDAENPISLFVEQRHRPRLLVIARTPLRIPATIWRKNASAGPEPGKPPPATEWLELVVNVGSSTEREATMPGMGQTTCPS